MPLFNQDPEISRRFGLGLGAGLLDTHGRPPGQILSQAILLGQKNADAERKLRLTDAQAGAAGRTGQANMLSAVKALHADRMAQWKMAAQRFSFGTGPDPGPPPDIGSTMAAFGTPGLAGAGQGAQNAPGPGVGQPPTPQSPPGGLLTPPGGVAQQPQSGGMPSGGLLHQGAPGQPGPVGAHQGAPESFAGGQPQGTGRPSPAVQQIQALNTLTRLGITPEPQAVSVANATQPTMLGDDRYDPVSGTYTRKPTEDTEYGPDGVLRRRTGLAESRALAKNVERTNDLGFDVANAPYTTWLAAQEAAAKEGGLLDARLAGNRAGRIAGAEAGAREGATLDARLSGGRGAKVAGAEQLAKATADAQALLAPPPAGIPGDTVAGAIEGSKAGAKATAESNVALAPPPSGVPGATRTAATSIQQQAGDLIDVVDANTGAQRKIPYADFVAYNEAAIKVGQRPLTTALGPGQSEQLRIAEQPMTVRGADGANVAQRTGDALNTNPLPGARGAQIGPTTLQSQTAANNVAWNEEERKRIIKVSADANQLADDASRAIDSIKQARTIMPQSTGRGVEAFLPLMEWFTSTNLATKEQVASVRDLQGFRGLMNDVLVGSQARFKGAVSDVEFKTAQQSLANIANTREANEFLLDFYQAANEKKIWYSNQMNRIAIEAQNAQRAGQDYNVSEQTAQLDRIARSDAMSIHKLPAMQRWSKSK